MAFLPVSNFLEETLLSSYNVSGGATAASSSDCVEFNRFSLQIIYASIVGESSFILEQSNDGTVWDEVDSIDYSIPRGTGSFTLDKQYFSGKNLRINLSTSGTGNSGTVTAKLVMKR